MYNMIFSRTGATFCFHNSLLESTDTQMSQVVGTRVWRITALTAPNRCLLLLDIKE